MGRIQSILVQALLAVGSSRSNQRWAGCISLGAGIVGLALAAAGPAAYGAKEFAVAVLAIAGLVNVAIGVYVLRRR